MTVTAVHRGALPVLRAADFQASWYFSIVVFAIVMLVVAGVVVGLWAIVPMWRNGDRALATLIGAVVGVGGLFFALLLTTVAVGLAPAAVGGGR